jgi:hypothetical protein
MVAQCSCFYSKIGYGRNGGYFLTGRRVSSDKIEQVGFQFLKLGGCIKRLFKKISLLKDATDCNFYCFDILVSTMAGILMLKSAVFTITDVTSSNRLSIF